MASFANPDSYRDGCQRTTDHSPLTFEDCLQTCIFVKEKTTLLWTKYQSQKI